MQIKNSRATYGWGAIILHWIIAIITIGLLILGLYMVRLPISLEKLQFYGWHKEFGIAVLMLVIIRIAWRLANVTPLLPAHMAAYEKLAARGAHWAFYILLFAMPISGWMLSSAAGLPVSFFGWFVLPDLVAPNPQLMHQLTVFHQYAAYVMIAVLFGHVSGALQHHFYYHDNILKRMLWPTKEE